MSAHLLSGDRRMEHVDGVGMMVGDLVHSLQAMPLALRNGPNQSRRSAFTGRAVLFAAVISWSSRLVDPGRVLLPTFCAVSRGSIRRVAVHQVKVKRRSRVCLRVGVSSWRRAPVHIMSGDRRLQHGGGRIAVILFMHCRSSFYIPVCNSPGAVADGWCSAICCST